MLYVNLIAQGCSETHYMANTEIPDGTAVTVKNSIDPILNDFNTNTRNLVFSLI